MAQRMSLLTWGFLVLSGLGVVLLIIGSPGIDVAVPVGALVLFVVLINRGIVKLWEALRPERTPYPWSRNRSWMWFCWTLRCRESTESKLLPRSWGATRTWE